MHGHIQVIVMSSGQPMTRQLAEWLKENKLEWRYGSTEYGIDLARNQNINHFLNHDVPLGKIYLLGIDHDMIPIRETRHILRGDDELIYCGYCGRHSSPGHAGAGDFGAACFRARADLLNRMACPWWRTTVVGGRRVACECSWFRRRAAAAGAKPKMVGIIGHRQECVLIPSTDAPGYSVMWDEELAEKHGARTAV